HDVSVADHFSVAFLFDFASQRRWRLSAHAVPADRTEDEIAEQFQSAWDSNSFDALLNAGDVDGAWALLSSAAERAMMDELELLCGSLGVLLLRPKVLGVMNLFTFASFAVYFDDFFKCRLLLMMVAMEIECDSPPVGAHPACPSMTRTTRHFAH
ncbi:MDN1, partial [Symbiodinium sp. KB8]